VRQGGNKLSEHRKAPVKDGGRPGRNGGPFSLIIAKTDRSRIIGERGVTGAIRKNGGW